MQPMELLMYILPLLDSMLIQQTVLRNIKKNPIIPLIDHCCKCMFSRNFDCYVAMSFVRIRCQEHLKALYPSSADFKILCHVIAVCMSEKMTARTLLGKNTFEIQINFCAIF